MAGADGRLAGELRSRSTAERDRVPSGRGGRSGGAALPGGSGRARRAALDRPSTGGAPCRRPRALRADGGSPADIPALARSRTALPAGGGRARRRRSALDRVAGRTGGSVVIGSGAAWAASGGGWAAVGAALLAALAAGLCGRPSASTRSRRLLPPGGSRRAAAAAGTPTRRRPPRSSTADAALAVDLLGAALQAGLAVEPALDVVERAMPTSSAGPLLTAARA